MLQKDNLNLIFKNILYNKKKAFFNNYSFNIKDFNIIENLCDCFYTINVSLDKTYFYNLLLYDKLNDYFNDTLKLKYKSIDTLKEIILNVNRTSFTVKNDRIYQYKITTGIGSKDGWVGIGKSRGNLFKKSFIKSLNISRKYIYNLNFDCNDYKQLKYKGCKFKALNMEENNKNLKLYNNITEISGDKKIKLISYSSKTPVNVLKSILNIF